MFQGRCAKYFMVHFIHLTIWKIKVFLLLEKFSLSNESFYQCNHKFDVLLLFIIIKTVPSDKQSNYCLLANLYGNWVSQFILSLGTVIIFNMPTLFEAVFFWAECRTLLLPAAKLTHDQMKSAGRQTIVLASSSSSDFSYDQPVLWECVFKDEMGLKSIWRRICKLQHSVLQALARARWAANIPSRPLVEGARSPQEKPSGWRTHTHWHVYCSGHEIRCHYYMLGAV